MGQAPKGSTYNVVGEGYPLIAGAGDFGECFPKPKKWTNAPTKIGSAGDILLCIRATIGDLNWVRSDCCLGRGVAGLRAQSERLDQKYLWHWLTYAAPDLRAKGRGATFLQISKSDLHSIALPLPALFEQKRIARILDAADALRAKRRESIAQLDALVQSRFLEMFGDPVSNPMKWETRSLDSLLQSVEGGWSPKCLARPATLDEWGVLKLGAVTWCSFDESAQKALPEDTTTRKHLEVKAGDLLFARKNTSDLVAATVYVREVRPKLLFPDLMFRLKLKPSEGANEIFLWQLLVEPRQRGEIRNLASGAAGSMPNISKAKLKAVEVIAPPSKMQEQFATKVGAVELQKAKLLIHSTELDTLFASLQSRAFAGEL